MSENCEQSCASCTLDCEEREGQQPDFSEKAHEMSNIKKVIGVVSGKGGVGKSLITSMLAVAMRRRGHQVGILDADVTGPSIPKAFDIRVKASGSEFGLLPAKTKTGIDIISINMLLDNDTDPVIWRGPIIANAVKQFWTDVIWSDVDFLFIDMPPGTGDVPLTVFQSVAVDGIIVVTSPQELVSMIVTKAVKMAELMNIPILGLVENMSYFTCPDNGKDYKIFGESHIEKIAAKHSLKVLGRLPVDPEISAACDRGEIELLDTKHLEGAADLLEGLLGGKTVKIAVASDDNRVAEHFGHCESFNIFEAKGGEILKRESIPNPGHKPGFLPNFLKDLGVEAIISNGMGSGAIDIFRENCIEVIIGASGDAEAAARAYLSGALKSTGSACHGEGEHSS